MTQQLTALPPVEAIAMHRLAFGPRPGDVEHVKTLGLSAWLNEQLSPDDAADELCNKRLDEAKLKIAYAAGKDKDVHWDKVEEDRPLTSIKQQVSDLWHLTRWDKPMAYEERVRPFVEVRAATWIRAVYSKYQLREVMTDFWHNHFNVNAEVDVAAQVTFPMYDRDVIRKNCFGNFRQFLEAVATSVPMLRYLNNAGSRASPANENYARELFELHTLGAENYYNHLYNRWRDVPGATEGKPVGYIDQDVYEAARAFTGWTYGAGQWAREGETLPNDGRFVYYEGWHDNYQKRVLASEFDPNQPPMADGRKVLDLVAQHPGTARHVCTKLCKRLVSDDPPKELVDAAVATWTKNVDASDQIAQTIRTIVMSEQFANTWGQKVKRPMEFVAAMLRATNAEFTPNLDFLWHTMQSNQKLFAWATPTGHPDEQGFWLGAGTMVQRWLTPIGLVDGWFATIRTHVLREMPNEVQTCRQTAEFWAKRMYGHLPNEDTTGALIAFVSRGSSPDGPLPGGDRQVVDRVCQLVGLIAMSPEFHKR